ncbi:hypothetical protein PVAP13_9NG738077 [Panicum virgatum]|uniref:Uncharacterized protein n=1 Tax=Panicum virgatum TaxID=38727 RepID=A0A8T0N2J7_PANVG|nr:hypothetical protein PVAP13_9NG738077 [Panicum virgatum]
MAGGAASVGGHGEAGRGGCLADASSSAAPTPSPRGGGDMRPPPSSSAPGSFAQGRSRARRGPSLSSPAPHPLRLRHLLSLELRRLGEVAVSALLCSGGRRPSSSLLLPRPRHPWLGGLGALPPPALIPPPPIPEAVAPASARAWAARSVGRADGRAWAAPLLRLELASPRQRRHPFSPLPRGGTARARAGAAAVEARGGATFARPGVRTELGPVAMAPAGPRGAPSADEQGRPRWRGEQGRPRWRGERGGRGGGSGRVVGGQPRPGGRGKDGASAAARTRLALAPEVEDSHGEAPPPLRRRILLLSPPRGGGGGRLSTPPLSRHKAVGQCGTRATVAA